MRVEEMEETALFNLLETDTLEQMVCLELLLPRAVVGLVDTIDKLVVMHIDQILVVMVQEVKSESLISLPTRPHSIL